MGLTNAVHWLAWLITSFVMMMITAIMLVFVLKFGEILIYSDPVVIFVFFVAFTLSTVMLCFLISVFFSRANVAAACGGLIYITTYLPYVILTIFEREVKTPHLVISVSICMFMFPHCCQLSLNMTIYELCRLQLLVFMCFRIVACFNLTLY